MAARAYVGLGSNLGHPRRQLARALERLAWAGASSLPMR
jgi:7,8-dihydro-6-hydroxymethylpterin-pyrophosphokinase